MSRDDTSSNSSSSSDSSTENILLQNKRIRKEALRQFILENQQVDSMFDHKFATNQNLFQQNTNPTQRNRRHYIERNREVGHERLFNDYFAEEPVYPANVFRRRFRMQKHLFLCLVDAITASDQYFQQRPDATGRSGLSSLQKCTAAIRVLAYGTSADTVDEYMRMSETVVRDSLLHFVEGVISNFGSQYLRRPNEEDVQRLLYVAEQRGFPGMMGSIDCMHWEWKNCPNAWAGQYAGRNTKTTIILEAVASYDLWIGHAFFGTPGSCNDINVLQRSPVFNDILEGEAPKVNFIINGHPYNMGYYLTDGIYPSWAAFVKSITAPQLRKHKLFAQFQESARKDVERAFGVLQARFAFIKRPCLVWDDRLMGKIMMTCIIIHNMIVEDERDMYQTQYDTTEFIHTNDDDEEVLLFSPGISPMSNYMQNRSRIRDGNIHKNLKNDLIEHIWEKFGDGN